MPWRAYLEAHTEDEHLVWVAWFRLHEWRDMGYVNEADRPPDLSMDGCVPPETQERWAGRVAGAKFAVLADLQRKRAEIDGRQLTDAERENRDRAVKARFRMAREAGVTFKDVPTEKGTDK